MFLRLLMKSTLTFGNDCTKEEKAKQGEKETKGKMIMMMMGRKKKKREKQEKKEKEISKEEIVKKKFREKDFYLLVGL